jgi:hypothetical protein
LRVKNQNAIDRVFHVSVAGKKGMQLFFTSRAGNFDCVGRPRNSDALEYSCEHIMPLAAAMCGGQGFLTPY